ncbi:hypothetical protein TSOC_003920 [Tetrabaena socialis]|uniref:Uncharacterized protein n=1 Tax=Tetrabaena socialis TaxID=47790 RepID=A0A2J8AA94_9CHLO|nr:hypothetical protein TSOC_003920 [Tetrabaena socialis]|eukprot:PNH09444.1 hypothetical protein TSOC_003920 [Tetrabaena socialis]
MPRQCFRQQSSHRWVRQLVAVLHLEVVRPPSVGAGGGSGAAAAAAAAAEAARALVEAHMDVAAAATRQQAAAVAAAVGALRSRRRGAGGLPFQVRGGVGGPRPLQCRQAEMRNACELLCCVGGRPLSEQAARIVSQADNKPGRLLAQLAAVSGGPVWM